MSQKLGQTITTSMDASTTQAILKQINNILNAGVQASEMAITYDNRNYYNYVSEARVAEVASSAKMPNAYDVAVKAYNNAIAVNPYNPNLYFSLANFEARNAKYDEALRDLGRALQLKNNYLDAVFLLSQIYASKGDLQSAISAASVATQLNPQNAVLWFQNGLLRYNAKDFAGASEALGLAVKYQPDYANAKYFLGLSEARQGKTANAITIFEELTQANKDNQELALILANLRSGRGIFTDAKPPVTPTPEKRATLPLKEKKQ
jgi:tetratricopeptide (TPR) repeat protein